MSRWMCGGEPLEDYKMEPEGNPCAETVYYINLGYEHCMKEELEGFNACYFGWLKEKIRPSWECDEVCKGSKNPPEECCNHYERFHTCTDKCSKETHRDNIRMCFGDCIERSPFHPDGTCSENCGKHAPNGKCNCDFSCQTLGDCCDDFLNFCVAPHLSVLPAPGEKTYFESAAFANVVNHTDAVENVVEKPGEKETGTTEAEDPKQLAKVIDQELPKEPPEGIKDVPVMKESLLQQQRSGRGALGLRGGSFV